MKEKIRLQLEKIIHFTRRESFLWILLILAGLLIWKFSHSDNAVVLGPEVNRLDTFIPAGYVLIPIEIKNASQLEGMTGGTLVADLYEAAPESGHGPARLIGRRLKIIRAPLNPSVFAVLLREDEAPRILSSPGPFVAGLRPLVNEGHEMADTKSSPSIEYQE